MGSHRLNGYCRPCYDSGKVRHEQQKQAEAPVQYAKDGPYIVRENFMEFGIRFGDSGSLFPSEFPAVSNSYGLQKGGGQK